MRSNDLDNRLSDWQYGSHSLRLSTKIQVYTAVVISTLLYSAETWVLYQSGYLSGFTSTDCAPSLALTGKTTCQTKKSSRKPACPA